MLWCAGLVCPEHHVPNKVGSAAGPQRVGLLSCSTRIDPLVVATLSRHLNLCAGNNRHPVPAADAYACLLALASLFAVPTGLRFI